MDKKLLHQLVEYSYRRNDLDFGKVNQIAKILNSNRSYLKKYLNALKKREKSLSIFIDTPSNDFGEYENELKRIFPNKKIVWNVDPMLLLGMRVAEGDDILEISLMKSLDSIISKVKENYD